MARILLNMPSQFGGKHSGVSRVAFALLERLLALGGHSYVLRSNWSRAQLPAILQSDALTVVELPRPRIMIADVLRQCWSVPALCRKMDIDIVWNIDTFGSARGGKVRVTTVHDLYFATIPEMVGRRAAMTMAACARLVLGNSQRLVAISERTRTDLTAFLRTTAANCDVIYNDTTIGAETPAPAGIAEPYVLLVGNGTPNKNFGVVVAALARLGSQTARPVLVHVGNDSGGMIAQAMDRSAAPPRLIRTGPVSEERLAGLYGNAQCLIVPSLAEGFCLPIVEANALGCPIIAANTSVLPEIAGESALYFAPHDDADLAAKLEILLGDPALRAALVTKGAINRQRFSWDRSADQYKALFDTLPMTLS